MCPVDRGRVGGFEVTITASRQRKSVLATGLEAWHDGGVEGLRHAGTVRWTTPAGARLVEHHRHCAVLLENLPNALS
eukprot:5966963-Pleurochrysis_carterae.AAC.2